MATIFDSIASGFQGIGQSILDRRASVKVREAQLLDNALRPLLQQRQQAASDRLQGFIGSAGNPPIPEDFSAETHGLLQDFGPGSGLLANPDDLATRLRFAGELEGVPEFAGAGLNMLNNIMANEATARRQAPADNLALELAAVEQNRKLKKDALAEQQQRFSQGQSLESDFNRSLQGSATAMAGFTGLNAALDQGDPLAIQVAFTQLARLNDPGARMVTEGDVRVLESGLDAAARFNKALANVSGGKIDGPTIELIRGLGRDLAGGELRRGRDIFDALDVRREQNPLGITPEQVQGSLGVSGILSSDAALETFLNPTGQVKGSGPNGEIDPFVDFAPRQPNETQEQFMQRRQEEIAGRGR